MRNLRGGRRRRRPLSFESQGCFLTKYKSEGAEGAWTLDEELRLAQYEDKSGRVERGREGDLCRVRPSSPTLQRGAKKILLSSVTHVPSWQLGCPLAALGKWVGGRREIQTCRNFSAPRCSPSSDDDGRGSHFLF